MKIVEKCNSLDTIRTLASWLGPDDHRHTSTLGKYIDQQLRNLKEINVPSHRKINVIARGFADGSGRRSSSGASTARSSYPIEEAPEHITQLGDMSIYCHEPIWTVRNTKNIEKEYTEWLNGKKDSTENRRVFSKQSLGRVATNATMMDIKDFHSRLTHKICRVGESVALRIYMVCKQFSGVSKKFLENIKAIERKVQTRHNVQISFSQAEALNFFKKGHELLLGIGLDDITYRILSEFLTNASIFICELTDSNPDHFTRHYFEICSRIMFGFPFILIFRTKLVTASVNQLVVYEGYYIDKALDGCKLVGKGLSRRHITDDTLETEHEDAKQGNFLFSGGKAGPIRKIEYQEKVLQQQFGKVSSFYFGSV